MSTQAYLLLGTCVSLSLLSWVHTLLPAPLLHSAWVILALPSYWSVTFLPNSRKLVPSILWCIYQLFGSLFTHRGFRIVNPWPHGKQVYYY